MRGEKTGDAMGAVYSLILYGDGQENMKGGRGGPAGHLPSRISLVNNARRENRRRHGRDVFHYSLWERSGKNGGGARHKSGRRGDSSAKRLESERMCTQGSRGFCGAAWQAAADCQSARWRVGTGRGRLATAAAGARLAPIPPA